MRIGLIAEKTGVSRDTIRLYETMGLLKDVTRPHEYNNYKSYSPKNIDRIKLILTMKKLGLSLKECKTVLDTISGNEYDSTFQKSFVKQKLEEINQKIEALNQLKQTLTQYLDTDCDHPDISKINKS